MGVDSRVVVDCSGQNCPMPLVETRKAILNGNKGQIVKVIGTHAQSFEEIPMALEAMGMRIITREEGEDGVWAIEFQIQ